MWSGWTGDGIKTVLPAEANARVVARLVPAQTPAGAYAALEAHLLQSAARLFPRGVANVSVERLGFAAAPVVAPPDSLANAAAAEARAHAHAVMMHQHYVLMWHARAVRRCWLSCTMALRQCTNAWAAPSLLSAS